jgi:hypothetical protein
MENTAKNEFNEIKNEPLKFLKSYFSQITIEMNKQKEKLIEHIDQYYASMFEQLKTFENECVTAVECRDFTCYDSMTHLNDQEKEKDLKNTLLLYKNCDFKIINNDFKFDDFGKLEILNAYQEEENEIKKYLLKAIKIYLILN